MKAALSFLLGFCLTSTYGGGIVSTLDHASLEAAIQSGGLVQITTPGTFRITNTIVIRTNVIIEASVEGVILEAPNNLGFKIFGASCHFQHLTIANCKNTNLTVLGFGEGTYGGAIYVENGTLHVINCAFTNNHVFGAKQYTGVANGGAIAAKNSILNLTNSTFFGNSVRIHREVGGSAIGSGGAISVSGSVLNISGGVFENNFSSATPEDRSGSIAADGGAISSGNSTIHISTTLFSGNSTRGGGGAISLTSGSAKIERTIFSSNRSGGGAISSTATNCIVTDCYFRSNSASHPFSYHVGPVPGGAIHNRGHINIYRCTFEENLVVGAPSRPHRLQFPTPEPGTAGQGGAFYNSGNATVSLCTFEGNFAQGGADTFNSGHAGPGNGGAIYSVGNLSIIQSTFVSNATAGATSSAGNAISAEGGNVNLYSSIFSGIAAQLAATNTAILDSGYNLSSDASYPFTNGTNINLNLGDLGYYGGHTPTIPLLPNSPAINFGPIAATNSTDQRYYLRAAGERVDSGSFEFYPWGTDGSTLPTNNVVITTSHHDSTGEVNFTQGTVATGALLFLEASPGNNSGFLGWSGSVTSKSPQLFLIVTQDLQLTASFAILRNITISNSNPSAGHTSLTNATYPEGETVSVLATANRGSRFVRWTGTYNNTNNPLAFTLEADTQLTAIFEQAPSYSVAANSNGSGTVNPSSTNVFEGETLTLQATASPNHRFIGWTGSFNSTQNPLVITVTSNINLTANFQPTLFRLHFHDNTGLFAHWEGTLEEITHAQLDWPLGEPNRMPTYWQLASASDRFKRWDNGEAYLDLVWRGAQGEVAYWQVNNKLQMASGQVISGPANLGSWILAGGPYFDSANAFGVLWLHPPTGQLGTWFGTNQQTQTFLSPNSGWELIKARDFNSDGSADFLWQHTDTGIVGFWNGTQPFTSLNSSIASMVSPISGPVPGWRAVDLVDLDADGALDLLWQSKSTGAVAVWLLEGLQLRDNRNAAFIIPKNGPAFYHNPGPQWRIFAVKTSTSR